VNYYKELIKLQGKYNKIINDHKHPIDLNTNEQHDMNVIDETVQRVVDDITTILETGHEADKYEYTE
jgi:nitrogen regulatory protein PII